MEACDVRSEVHATTINELLARLSPAMSQIAFEPSGRQMRAEYSVAQAAEKLIDILKLLRRASHIIAGSLVAIRSYELEIEAAHHLYGCSLAVDKIRTRLGELRVDETRIDDWQDISGFASCTAVLNADSDLVFVSAVYLGYFQFIQDKISEYLTFSDPVLDMPSRCLLAETQRFLEEAGVWFQGSCRYAENVASFTWSKEFSAQIRSLIIVELRDGASVVGGPAAITSTLRQCKAQRDPRLKVFAHSRNYSTDDLPGLASGDSQGIMKFMDTFRTQRDELDAIETFANVLFDLQGNNFEFELFLARLVSDEARHSEMGQQWLSRAGYDPFDVPCSTIGIDVRTTMQPYTAFAQINIFGELQQVASLRRFSLEAKLSGDEISANALDFTNADELMHVKVGREWVKSIARWQCTSFDTVQEEARVEAINRLHELGIINEDYKSTITIKEMAAIIGE
ncbi:hypothetical protein [Pseudomonas brassicacearum]|uniref:hypothetical protein n=1 Tax=Pseudomonas brassicacearum TaxID=930166 RepID=UPI001D60F77C|nr:hypothetical protein [Pseudomonas brassicacearum]CAH0305660.1 hypothetical protein SRABI06_04725 [Pseudomonas brassicacearum]